MTDLGTMGGDFSSASGINNAGQVAGSSLTPEGSYRAFITGSNGMGMTHLGTLGGASRGAGDINDAGHVSGQTGNHLSACLGITLLSLVPVG
jgi:probable HAF family extracellular repeat protein